MNSLLQDSFVRPFGPGGSAGGETPAALPLDIHETENEFVVRASLPGVKPDDVQITVHGDTLTIRGDTKVEDEKADQRWLLRERRFGSFQRSVVLSTPINADKAAASFDHGVLTLTLPKAEEAKPRQIRLGSGGSGNGSGSSGK